MKHSPGNRRQRGRNRSNRGAGNTNNRQVFDSNGPDVRIRGTAQQIVEKYQALAKDSSSAGDLTMAENYLQHAEHYARIVMTYAPKSQDDKDASSPQRENQNDKGDLSLPANILGEGLEVNDKELEVA